uniref:ABC transporter domain-containing protein n=1 Tax=Ditylenchus dipsaci TaxID=166011 RepID=A0A915CWK6_9BILA
MKRQSCISAFVFACQFSFTYILIAITLSVFSSLYSEVESYARKILNLIASVADITKARVAAENIMNVINETAMEMDNLSDEGFRPKVVGRISMQNVEFRYPSRPVIPILKEISLQVAPGQSVAIVGPSGSGKSSIISLFQRMYEPTKGQVFLDNYNIRSVNPGYLHRVVVSVGQEPTLFSFTIKENISYGLPEDEATMDKIIEAAKVANIHEFISSYHRAMKPRAVVRNPVVLLLDEATAALDSTSEKLVQAALETASKNCTCITVAHRLSSIRKADRIIVLVEGKIAEQGTHQELMEEKGLYYEMNQLEI